MPFFEYFHLRNSTVTPNEYVFIYNHVQTRNPSPIQAAVGHGIACICLSIVDSSEKVVFSFPNKRRQPLTGELVQKALDSVQTDAGLEFQLSPGGKFSFLGLVFCPGSCFFLLPW